MPEFRTIPSRSETGSIAKSRAGRAATAIALVAALAGCAAQNGIRDAGHAEPTFLRLTEERVFAQALRQRYLELATNAYDRGDLDRSDFYSLRAIMAVEGKLVDPAGAPEGEGDPALDAARIRLIDSLNRGARIGSPDAAARAQAAYDCWWLESGPAGDPVIADACRSNTGTTLAELEVVGTGTRLADARYTPAPAPSQVVIDRHTPSQTIDAGGATIQIVNQPITYEAPAPLPPSYVSAAPVQHRSALSRIVPPIPQMETHAARPFSVGAPAPLHPMEALPSAPLMPEPVAVAPLMEFMPPADSVIPTVPLPDSAPIDLIPSFAPAPVLEAEPLFMEPIAAIPMTEPVMADRMVETVPVLEGSAFGGQYVPFEEERRVVSSMQPIYDEVSPMLSGDRVASIASPVYSDVTTAPAMPAPVMMEGSEDVLSTLVGARAGGGSDYSVYFGFDSDAITPEGEDVLIDTVERLTLEDRTGVSLMGFTDSAGDSRYNQLLAMRRANAVRKFIQTRTDRPIRFEIMPVGEVEAVRDGGDGVTEALNRRVEIVLR